MNCKVIATCFQNKKSTPVILDESGHVPVQYPSHYQNLASPEEYLEMVKEVIHLEMEHKVDVPYDLIIVNSINGYEYGDRELTRFNDTLTPNGRIRVIHRENLGWSFGAFDAAFNLFRDEYDYWLFTEDDIIVMGDQYYKRLIERFENTEHIGFLALVGTDYGHLNRHCHGGVGLTHRDILEKVFYANGQLPHYPIPTTDRALAIKFGEIPFTNEIDKLGYRLVTYGNNREWNLEKNLCIPYYNYALSKS